MASPVYKKEFAGVPIVEGSQQAVVFRSVDPTDPHGSTDALVSIGDVVRRSNISSADA